ncbi:MAG: hypothetical protein AAF583_05515 [Pseudomonadota bacterium]
MAWFRKLANRTLFLIYLACLNAQFANAERPEEPDIRALVDGLAEVETINRPAIVALPRIERLLSEGHIDEAKAGYLNWCGEGARLACFRYQELSLDAEAPENLKDARAFYDQACATGAAPACTRLGALLDSTDGGARDALRARAAYLSACEGRHPEGCVLFADFMSAGIGGPANRDEAGLLIREACEVGSAMGCFFEGVFAERDGELDRAIDLYDQSCSWGYGRACLSLYVRKGRAAASEEGFQEAYKYYAAACALHEGPRALSCYRAAEFATFPENPDAGSKRARQLFRRACELNHSRACDRLGGARPSVSSTGGESVTKRENEPR